MTDFDSFPLIKPVSDYGKRGRIKECANYLQYLRMADPPPARRGFCNRVTGSTPVEIDVMPGNRVLERFHVGEHSGLGQSAPYVGVNLFA